MIQPLLRRVFHLAYLPEFAMRRIRLEEILSGIEDRELLHLVEAILIEVRRRSPEAIGVYLPLVQILESPSYRCERNHALLELAKERMMLEVQYLLLDPPIHLPHGVEDEVGEGLPPFLKEHTLGERKSLARRLRDPHRLLQFLREQDPQVFRILLKNPGLKEDHLLRFIAHRPISQGILEAIWEEPHWLMRPRVQRALVLNPYTHPRISLKFLPLLTPQDLEEVEGAWNLHPLVAEFARKLLILRDYSLRSKGSETARER
jgi:hypothetical protein